MARLALETSPFQLAARAATGASALARHDWQVEPALAFHDGNTSRVLVADAVGLGKTVQAGWALTTLCDPAHDRALILVPAGLRDQWQAELSRLFGVRTNVVDAAYLRSLRARLPPALNPWSLPGVLIAAIDFVKQPEVLAGVLEARWSVVVLDEAHSLTARTDRRRAADLVARNADHVLLLTATPHSGDQEAFEHLCRIGARGNDPLVVFRRSREDIGLRIQRRTRRLHVRLNDAERRLHAELRRYIGRLRREALLDRPSTRLIAWVLLKRAASSGHALYRTLLRRRSALGSGGTEPVQEPLPFGPDGEHDDADERLPEVIDAPALPDRHSELGVLDRLVALAAGAAASDSKRRAAARLVGRLRESVVVFTGYRDTLQPLASALDGVAPYAVLHGGMTRAERAEAGRAFTSGAARVLLATDAVSEGLNLHHGCRLVVHCDLPWNPMKLEQRTGRVDRIGQQRRVHAIMLVGDSRIERALARRLLRRHGRMGQELDRLSARQPSPSSSQARPTGSDAAEAVAILDAAAALVSASTRRRRPSREGRTRSPADGERSRPSLPWTEVRTPLRRRLGLPPGVLLVFRIASTAGAATARIVGSVPVMVECDASWLRQGGRRALLRACERIAGPMAEGAAPMALAAALQAQRQRADRKRQRLAAALEELPASPPLYQQGLFDRRAMTAALHARARDEKRRAETASALEQLVSAPRHDAGCHVRPVAALVLR